MKRAVRFFELLLILAPGYANHLMAQWVHNGPNGGVIRCFAVSGSNLFAGTDGDGVFLSTDNGARWSRAGAGLPPSPIYALAAIGVYFYRVQAEALCRRASSFC